MSYRFTAGNEIKADQLDFAGITYYDETGAADAYVIDPQVDGGDAYSALEAGQVFAFIPDNDNTGASTLVVNAIASKSILHLDGTALKAGDINAGQPCVVIYNGTNFRILNPNSIGQTDGDTLTGGSSSNADSLHTHAILPSYAEIYLNTSTPPQSSNDGRMQFALSPDGTYGYMAWKQDVTETVKVVRFALDTLTGLYHYENVTASLDKATYGWGGDPCSLTVGDTYVWVAASTGSNTIIVRLAADLTSPTLMTISGTAFTGDVASMCGDGSNLYMTAGSTTVITYSISGTTATRGSDITLTAAANYDIFEKDSTHFFLYDRSNQAVLKYAVAGGAVVSTTKRNFGLYSNDLGSSATAEDARYACVGLTFLPDLTMLYGVTFRTVNSTSSDINVLAFTKIAKP